MKNNYIKAWLRWLPEAVLIFLFILFHWHFLNLDFWNDEIYTIKKFVLKDFLVIITDYHVPNNHIFSNLMTKVYFELLGIENLNDVLECPWRIRLLPMLYAIASMLLIFKISTRFLTRETGWLTVGLLITTLPYSIFVLQMRGYGLSMLLILMLVYFLLLYFSKPKMKLWIGVMISTCLIFYTLTSNLYTIFSVLVFLGIFFFRDLAGGREKNNETLKNRIINSSSLHLALAVLSGVAIALLFYAPIFKDVFTNDYVTPGEAFQTSELIRYSKGISEGILTYRWALLPLVIAGFIVGYKFLNKPYYLVVLICLTLIPVLLVFLRGDKAPIRVFSVFLPIYISFMAFSIMALFKRIVILEKYIPLLVLGLLLYSGVISQKEHIRNEKKIGNDIIDFGRSQNFYYHYYAYHFQPMEDVRWFAKNHFNSQIPVVIVGCETHDIPHYLDYFEIPHYDSFDLDSLKKVNDTLHLVTNHPYEYPTDSIYNMRILNEKLTYHNFLLYSRKKE